MAPHRHPRSPHLPSHPLRRQSPPERAALDQRNRHWLLAYASSDDPAARLRWRNRLVEANLGLVHAMAARYAGVSQLPLNDLVQVGAQGLIRAVEAFDGRRAVRLSTFAMPYVRGAIQHELRDRESWIRLPRRLWELRHRMGGLQERRRTAGLPPLGRDGLAEALGCSRGELEEAEILREVAIPLRLDAPQGGSGEGGDSGTWLEQLADPRSLAPLQESAPDQGRTPRRDAQLRWLRDRLQAMEPHQRELLLARVLVGCTWVELGRQFGLHPRMAERRCNAALQQLRSSAEGWPQGMDATPVRRPRGPQRSEDVRQA